MKPLPMLGQKHGMLTVLKEDVRVNGRKTWVCICECGNIVDRVDGCALRSGKRVSCGCKKRGDKSPRYKHGDTRTKLYNVFKTMHRRCESETSNRYSYYGGRGIRVCNEWSDYAEFRRWAIENGYADGLTLDRIDNDGDYSPDNCRWTTMRVQSNNRRNTVFVEIDGETRPIAEWAALIGVPYNTVMRRWQRGCRGKNLLKGVRA